MEIKYRDWGLDSNEELQFCYWLEALEKVGYVESFIRVKEPISLFDKVYFNFTVNNKPLRKFILHPMEYTPDFCIKWGTPADGKLFAKCNGSYTNEEFKKCVFYTEDNCISLVDVKGVFKGTRLVSSITFPLIQKILAYKGIYVQSIVPFGKKGLFEKTFTPKEYLKTSTGKDRKINWNIVTLKDYLNN